MTRYNKRIRVNVGRSLPKRVGRALFAAIKPILNVGAIVLLLLVSVVIRPMIWLIRLMVRAAS